MDLVFLNSSRIDQYVIEEYDETLIKVPVKYSIHQTHEQLWRIGQPKEYNRKLIMPKAFSKSSLKNISLLDMKLIVSQLKINL